MMLIAGFSANAHDFEVNGIYYTITSIILNEVEVDSDMYGSIYLGDIVIPESVTYSGKKYSVTSIGEGAFYGCSGLTSVNIGK